MERFKSEKILSAATVTGAGSAFECWDERQAFQALGTTSSGAGAASIKIQGSLDNSNWIDLGTITLTLATTSSSDGFGIDVPWRYVRANVSSISGTGASVTVWRSVR